MKENLQTLLESITLLDQVAEQASVPRRVHLQAQTAVQMLRKFIDACCALEAQQKAVEDLDKPADKKPSTEQKLAETKTNIAKLEREQDEGFRKIADSDTPKK
ncbi:hypothetical protein LCGC14_1422840 [marine sediment metagenome]|uniref:Uncharacterized protein n=1 Tax=marine sediment metagenome TaxID=412755 RepID=A0A0F9MSI9_9ZZZZ